MRLAFSSWRRRVSLHAGIIAAVLAACLLLLGLDGWSTWQAGEAAMAADRTETANLARSLAQHAHDTLHVADVILSGLRERVETDPPAPERTERLDRLIAMRLEDAPALGGLAVFDAAMAQVARRPSARRDPRHADRACGQPAVRHRDRQHRGACVLPRLDGDGADAATLVERADAALHRAKRPGRDRAVTQGMADPDVADAARDAMART